MIDTSARLLRLLSVLQARRFWSGAELAERLEVTPRTLRRDIDRLRSLGYVVDATSGPGGGYALGTGASLPPLLLDDDEAVAVTVALRSAADSFAKLGETAVRVLSKLEPLLPARLRKRVGALQAVTVSVQTSGPALDAALLTTLAAACRDGEQLELAYRARDGRQSTRTVDPFHLAHTGTRRWYLVAWDHGRGDWRTFRVDRVERVRPLHKPVTRRDPPPDVAGYVADSIAHAPYRLRATVRLRGSAAQLAERIPRWIGALEPLDAKHCLLRTGADSVEGLACQLILTGTDFDLVEPRSLAPRLRRVARRIERGVATR